MSDRSRWVQSLLLAVLVGAALLACKKKRAAPPAPTVAATPTSTAAAAAPQGFAGSYTIQSGKNPDGSSYSGSVSISSRAGYDAVDWTISSGRGDGFSGVGIEMGGLLGVGWGKSKPGVVVYKVSGGSLTGKWAMAGASGLGTENLSGPAGVSGRYNIVSSSSPASGGAYHGTVTITPNGAVRTVRWSLTSGESYSGVGMLDGDTFVVGWGQGVGVVVYHLAGGSLTGRFASPGTSGIGSETLARK